MRIRSGGADGDGSHNGDRDLVSKAPKPHDGDDARPCDAVSQGLGFEMKPTTAPTVVAKVPASPPSLCP